jgi:hypothetical protein
MPNAYSVKVSDSNFVEKGACPGNARTCIPFTGISVCLSQSRETILLIIEPSLGSESDVGGVWYR